VIWLVWRRYRILLFVILGILAALGLWMLLLGRASEGAVSSYTCLHSTFHCNLEHGAFSLSNQATAVNALLLFVPCLLGVVFGAPLVAAELEHHTNRLVWTQGMSRTKWLVVKWSSVLVVLALMMGVLTLVAQWWTGHVIERSFVVNIVAPGSQGRVQPVFFPITGIAPIAYTVFAFALGAALGSIIRKTSWAIVGTVVAYTAVSVLAVLVVRPSLAPQLFVPFPSTHSAQARATYQELSESTAQAWNLGFGFRYAPGSANEANGGSANAVAERCQQRNYNYTPYLSCLSAHHIQMGSFYQPGSHYWDLQWRESALLIGMACLLFGATLWSVRRWRA
jgi:hypothetical protein